MNLATGDLDYVSLSYHVLYWVQYSTLVPGYRTVYSALTVHGYCIINTVVCTG